MNTGIPFEFIHAVTVGVAFLAFHALSVYFKQKQHGKEIEELRREHRDDIKAIRDDHNDHETKVDQRLDRMESKIDSMARDLNQVIGQIHRNGGL